MAVRSYERPKLSTKLQTYAKDHIKQAFWYGFAKAVIHVNETEKESDGEQLKVALEALDSFRKLGVKCVCDLRFFVDSKDQQYETFQALVRVEETRNGWDSQACERSL